MSGAPTCSGICQFARPVQAGITAPKIMNSACIVVIELKNIGSTNCRPGLEQLRADDHRHHAADEEHQAGEHQVHRADVLVVGREHPAAPAVRLVVVMSSWRRASCRRRRVSREPCLCVLEKSDQPAAAAAGGGGRCGAAACFCCFGGGLQPRVEVFLAAHVDDDGHEAVVAAAELDALAAIEAGLVRVDLEPHLVDVARDRVLLHAEGRHPPGVDDVRRRDQQAHLACPRARSAGCPRSAGSARWCSDRRPSPGGARHRSARSRREKKHDARCRGSRTASPTGSR